MQEKEIKWKIPLFKMYSDSSDRRAVSDIIKSGINWATGPEVVGFEKAIGKFLNRKYVLVFNSGTSALHALMLAYDFKEGDEIIVPSMTFIATCNAPLFVGAKPVFADIEEETFGLDPECVKLKITKRTKAIIPIHYGGHPCQINKIRKIAKKNNIILIEDAAQAFGAKVKKQKVGTFGDSAILSFCASKIITTGEGGAVVTDNKGIYEKLKLLRSHGRLDVSDYFSSTDYMDYVSIGYNLRMSNILAALGLSQIKKAEKIIRARNQNALYLSKALLKIDEVEVPHVLKSCTHVFQMYTIRVRGDKKQRDALQKFLIKNGVMAKVYFYPVHLSKFYKELFKYKPGVLPVTEKISTQILTLPMYPSLKKSEMDYMAKLIKEFFKNGK